MLLIYLVKTATDSRGYYDFDTDTLIIQSRLRISYLSMIYKRCSLSRRRLFFPSREWERKREKATNVVNRYKILIYAFMHMQIENKWAIWQTKTTLRQFRVNQQLCYRKRFAGRDICLNMRNILSFSHSFLMKSMSFWKLIFDGLSLMISLLISSRDFQHDLFFDSFHCIASFETIC